MAGSARLTVADAARILQLEALLDRRQVLTFEVDALERGIQPLHVGIDE